MVDFGGKTQLDLVENMCDINMLGLLHKVDVDAVHGTVLKRGVTTRTGMAS